MNPGAGDPTSAPKNCWLDGPIFRHDVRSPNLIVKVSPHVILTAIHGTKLYFLARTHTSSGSGPGIGSTKRIQKRFRLDGALPVAMNVLFATWRTCLEKALAVIDIRLKQAILHKRRPKILKFHSSNDLSSYMHTGNIKKATEDNPSKNHNQINKPNQTFSWCKLWARHLLCQAVVGSSKEKCVQTTWKLESATTFADVASTWQSSAIAWREE